MTGNSSIRFRMLTSRVQQTHTMGGSPKFITHYVNQCIDVPEAEAERLFEAGQAVPATEEDEKRAEILAATGKFK
jgi:hypothetical protein